MKENGFEVSVARRETGVVLILSGTVNRDAKERMEAAYAEASALNGRILLDFSAVEYINSTGIAVIVGLLAMARSEKREIGAFGLTDHYRKVFQITRLADFMTMFDNEDAASAAGV
jgi:anti-sigma B factor antagonist